MNYSVIILITVITAVVITVLSCTTAFAWDHDERWMAPEVNNEPEGTAFVDLFVKCKGNDEWAVDFNEETAEQLSVSRECGLANYNEDSHVLFNKFKSVKIAFCNEKGDIISVSNSVRIPNGTLRAPVMYYFETDGEELSFCFSGASWSRIHSIVFYAAVVVAFLIILIRIIRKQFTSYVKSGEVENV